MSYENSYSLKVKNAELNQDVKYCSNCNINIPSTEPKFCSACGTELIESKLEYDGTDQIISEFRNRSEDANYLIKNNGETHCTGSGHSIEKDLVKFSEVYPTVLFELNIKWDSGFGDPPSRYYVKDGKIQTAKVQVIFEDFDETKLK